MRRTLLTRRFAVWVVVTLCALIFGASACASGSKQAKDDTEVGQPPAADDPDSQPRTPPQGPDVDMSDGGEPEQKPAATPAPDGAPTVTAAQIQSFMEKGPPYALTITRVEPHRINGSFAGFELIAMHPSAKRFLGEQLSVGDVVTHINGVRMKKPDDYLSAWKLLDDVDAVRIKYLRKDEEQEAVWRVVDGGSDSGGASETTQ